MDAAIGPFTEEARRVAGRFSEVRSEQIAAINAKLFWAPMESMPDFNSAKPVFPSVWDSMLRCYPPKPGTAFVGGSQPAINDDVQFWVHAAVLSSEVDKNLISQAQSLAREFMLLANQSGSDGLRSELCESIYSFGFSPDLPCEVHWFSFIQMLRETKEIPCSIPVRFQAVVGSPERSHVPVPGQWPIPPNIEPTADVFPYFEAQIRDVLRTSQLACLWMAEKLELQVECNSKESSVPDLAMALFADEHQIRNTRAMTDDVCKVSGTSGWQLPSKRMPTNIAKQAARDTYLKDYAKSLKIPKPSYDTPHEEALRKFLHFYSFTPNEEFVYTKAKEYSRPPAAQSQLVEEAAERAGIPKTEYVARETLKHLIQVISSHGLSLPNGSATEPFADEEHSPKIREYARQLFGSGHSDDQLIQYMRSWYSTEHKPEKLAFDAVPSRILLAILKAKAEGKQAKIQFVFEKGERKPFVAVTQDGTRGPNENNLNASDLAAFNEYLAWKIHGVGNAPKMPSATFGWLWYIEELRWKSVPIGSDDFNTSKLSLIPRETIHMIAHEAGVSLIDAMKLSLFDLLELAACQSKHPTESIVDNTVEPADAENVDTGSGIDDGIERTNCPLASGQSENSGRKWIPAFDTVADDYRKACLKAEEHLELKGWMASKSRSYFEGIGKKQSTVYKAFTANRKHWWPPIERELRDAGITISKRTGQGTVRKSATQDR